VSADRRLLAFPRRPYDHQIQVWNIVDNKLSSTLALGSPAGILSLAFSPDGGQLAVALGQGPLLSIWDLASARQMGSRGAFKVLNPRSGEVLHTLQLQPVAPLSQTTLDLPLGPSALSGMCLLPLLVLLPDHAGAASASCPAPVVDQLDGLYRWQVARQDERGPIDLSSQQGRFTPGLDQQLPAAHQLNPADGRFVDFDVFSGTQVRTFGARVLGCATGWWPAPPVPGGSSTSPTPVSRAFASPPSSLSCWTRSGMEM
jgi:hypothetical protein